MTEHREWDVYVSFELDGRMYGNFKEGHAWSDGWIERLGLTAETIRVEIEDMVPNDMIVELVCYGILATDEWRAKQIVSGWFTDVGLEPFDMVAQEVYDYRAVVVDVPNDREVDDVRSRTSTD